MESFHILNGVLTAKIIAWFCGPLGLIANISVIKLTWKYIRPPIRVNHATHTSSRSRNLSYAFLISKKKERKLSQVASLFFFNLSLADIFSSSYITVLAICDISFSSVHQLTWCNNSHNDCIITLNDDVLTKWSQNQLCHLLRFMAIAGCLASACFTLAITVDRLILLLYPLKLNRRSSFKSGLIICLSIWLLAVGWGIATCAVAITTITTDSHTDIFHPLNQSNHFQPNWYSNLCLIDDIQNTNVAAFAVFITINIVLIYITTLVVYIIITIRLRKARIDALTRGPITWPHYRHPNRYAEYSIISNGLIVLTNILCWIPNVFWIISFTLNSKLINIFQDHNAGTISILLFSLHGLTNPIIFIILYIITRSK